jgi:hypothetical protein
VSSSKTCLSTIFLDQISFFLFILGLFRSQISFFINFQLCFISRLFHPQFVWFCIAARKIIIIVLCCLFLVYLLMLESIFIIWKHCKSLWLWLVGFLVLKELKENKLWGTRHSVFVGVESLILSETRATWGTIFYTTNKFLQI